MTRKLTPYVFVRKEGFYVVEIPADQLQANIDLNPGTTRVEDMRGKVLWRQQ